MNKMCDAEVLAQDACLGDFFEQLRKRDILDQTVLIVVSDHGDHLGEKQRFSHMFGAYQPLVHVPLIIRDPLRRLQAGQRINQCVSTRRLFHTALDIAGVATPDEVELSLFALASENERSPAAGEVFVEAIPPRWVVERLKRHRPELVPDQGYHWPVQAMYKDGYKLLVRQDVIGLYALRDDPQELRDVSARFPHKISRMDAELRRFVSRVQPQAAAVEHTLDRNFEKRLRELGYL
jgi:arylsulfatase A-like enzyme